MTDRNEMKEIQKAVLDCITSNPNASTRMIAEYCGDTIGMRPSPMTIAKALRNLGMKPAKKFTFWTMDNQEGEE